MDKASKKKLEDARHHISLASGLIDQVRDDAQTAFDEETDKWKESAIGLDADEKLAYLQQAIDELESVDACIAQATTGE